MKPEPDLKLIPDVELLRRLDDLLGQSRRVEADLVAHIGEVDPGASSPTRPYRRCLPTR